MSDAQPGCELCALDRSANWRVLGSSGRLSVVRVLDAPAFPAFYRVVWRDHVAEWSDLGAADRLHCMDALVATETALREVLTPRKINLASLGNMVPHLHWHVLARFEWDTHFPQPIWGAVQRAADEVRLAAVREALQQVDDRICSALAF